ncbi:hypothetical protein VOLCADRAFT_108528 [Volvox carteri f. nagariensis]|uniref:Uncharacterized protein n=1 Tax=Volvox carteri f. nagariensis TaxID=3068 RepID=D8UKP9_VOLCA|nr:uncharacterized protein VOLCADRAFT_108528 [Volvox carteri f. nagariensis]EFJ39701.1 hypothetical protein VOLCADRAFT_108528 [Volvox carteri f. nagariensis]|eukprot:XP_002959241.1 hypothetical protein VOLCADRAFT_108528 [Volvox carteri f. nagariensis]
MPVQEFSEYFPKMDTEIVDALYEVYKQTLGHVRSHCQAEYEMICAEYRVPDRLRDLEGSHHNTAGPISEDAARLTPGRTCMNAPSGAPASQGPSVEVVQHAERIARRHALLQEAAHLEDTLEKARRTENRLSAMLAMRQEAVEKIVTTYQRVVTDVKQVYDITRVWPKEV